LCWCSWQEAGFSRREDVFTSKEFTLKRHFIYFSALSAICEDNDAVNCIAVKHKKKKCSFPSTLTGRTALVNSNTNRHETCVKSYFCNLPLTLSHVPRSCRSALIKRKAKYGIGILS
jgi:hypothetical protein